MIRLEICANGIKSLQNAMDGCAQCVELCECLEVGGVTPSFGTLAKAIDISFIPMRVLIRPRPGNYIYDEDEVEMMKTDIMLCKKLGFEGVVIKALIVSTSSSPLLFKAPMTTPSKPSFLQSIMSVFIISISSSS